MHVHHRRDFKLLPNATKNVAIMHQASLERDHKGCMVATLRDYKIARELLNDLLSQGIGATVSKEMRKTVAAVKDLTVDVDHTTNKAVSLGRKRVVNTIISAMPYTRRAHLATMVGVASQRFPTSWSYLT